MSASSILGAAASAPTLDRRARLALFALVVLAFALRAWAVAQYQEHHPLADRPVIDEASYDRWAREIDGGDWLGSGVFFQEPLYPYLLGATYGLADDASSERELARYLQAALGAATVALVGLLGARIFGAAAGLVAAAALATYRPAIWFPTLLLKGNAFLPLFVGFALLAITVPASGALARARWLAAGVLAGAGALLRGNMLVLAPFFVAWPVARALLERRPWRGAVASSLAVLVGIALALAPVALRNQWVGGRLVLTTSGAGTNFYGGNNLDNPHGVAKEFDWVRGIPEFEADDWRREAERRVGHALDPKQTSSFWLREALRSMAEQPFEHARILWRKLRLTLGVYEVPDNHFLEWDARYVALLRAPLPGFALWGSLGLAGLLWVLAADRRRAPLELAALFALYLATIVATVTSDRVRLVLTPFLCVFAGAFVVGVARRRREARSLAIAGACLAVACVAVLAPVYRKGKLAEDLDERDYNLAVLLLRDDGDLARARALLEGIDPRRAGTPRVALLALDLRNREARRALEVPGAGQDEILRARDEIAAVVAELDRLAPRCNAQELFRVRVLRGAIAQHAGDFVAAERDYRAAREFDPDDRDLRRRLGVALANRAMLPSTGAAERIDALREAHALLAGLLGESGDADLARLTAELERELERAQGR